ncbi:MAG: tRNA (adenosine(37)-N6)-dimethylallyltransferase MiaA [Bacteroidales bacterium]|nr:tRNA (adenosine(37)-N6)-dimethylallyltransferase MiaA [Bacteroidales bacterium]
MKRLVVIVGPTAIGKTAVAIRLAQHLDTEIISCDSRQFYRELNIGVARPSPEELSAAKHHFIACRSVSKPYNVFEYEQDALSVINLLFKSHDNVIAVGGSGLYIDAICQGINIMPDPTPELRTALSSKIKEGRLDDLLNELKKLDPDYYDIVDRKNPIRIQRALEVIYTSGEKYSKLIDKTLPPRQFKITKIGLHCERDELKKRIYSRVDAMIATGLVEEARSLLPFRNLNTLNTVGYKELFYCFDGKKRLETSITEIKNHTWQYAKKQMTWLNRYKEINWAERNNFQNILQVLGQ